MEDSFAKVMSLAAFIVLGHLLRRFNILKDQAFAAISALVMNVTLPCVILTNLNGVRIEGDMLLIAGLGLLTNIIFLVWGLFLSRNIADTQWRDFVRLNVGGYSVGPFAVPYVQSFFPTTGLMATCMFDVGNCVMAGGGTFAVIAGTRVKTTLWRTVKLVVSKLVRSGPLVTFAFVGLMSVLDMRLPDGVITSTAIGAHANTFLCMIMIGESISFSMGGGKMGKVLKLLASRWVVCILIALGVWHFLPFEEEIRMALTLTCLSPIPAMSLVFTAQLDGDIAMAANMSSLSVGRRAHALRRALTHQKLRTTFGRSSPEGRPISFISPLFRPVLRARPGAGRHSRAPAHAPCPKTVHTGNPNHLKAPLPPPLSEFPHASGPVEVPFAEFRLP